jgi:ABC-2 type transport system ATP-binding protein
VLFSTHYLDEAEKLCDRVAIIDRGRIVATGAPRELIANSSGVQTVTLVTSHPLSRANLEALPHAGEVVCHGNHAHFQTSQAAGTLAALAQLLQAQKVEVLDLHVRKASLEDVFIGLTRAEEEGAA